MEDSFCKKYIGILLLLAHPNTTMKKCELLVFYSDLDSAYHCGQKQNVSVTVI